MLKKRDDRFWCWLAGAWFMGMASLGIACKRDAGPTNSKRPLVVCTTTMICDAVRQVGGEAVQVADIIPPKQDPHIYTPRPRDGILFRRAHLIFVNGLHLEGKMIDMIENAGKKAISLAEDKRIKRRKTGASLDPHVWWDASFFAYFVEQIRDALVGMLPNKKQIFVSRAASYMGMLHKMHRWAKASILLIPKEKRVMITSHDAFFYFGAAYGIEVDAVLGISTDAQARAAEPLRLAGVVARRKVDAIFHETSVSQAQNDLVDSIQRLAKSKHGVDVKIAGPLFSDSLSEPGLPTGSYVGAFRANVEMIVRALGAKPLPFALQKRTTAGVR
ncbi:MAG: zinc ABC transporter substrate-binding protein [Myxococcales bacterium]|nr:zinc ABC transporter substrate-binding protein [Myxococcales bacterium]